MTLVAAPLLAVLALLPAPDARAAKREIPLAPPLARISYTVFALGLLPIVATFDRFAGIVTQDPAKPGMCRIRVTVDVDSLHMDDPNQRTQALAPDMLDVAHFPTMRFVGGCAQKAIAGDLTLHGVTRPVTLAMWRDGNRVVCTGNIARGDFGILGMAGLVAPRVRIRLNVNLPE